MTKRCLICGSEFKTNFKHQKYCCYECKQIAKKKNNHKGYLKRRSKLKVKNTIVKTCPVCGNKFITTKNNQKYCSHKCSYEVIRKRSKDYQNRKKNGTINRVKVCPVCGNEFEQTGHYRVYCSDECKKNSRHAAKKKYPCSGYKPEEVPLDLCFNCNLESCRYDYA